MDLRYGGRSYQSTEKYFSINGHLSRNKDTHFVTRTLSWVIKLYVTVRTFREINWLRRKQKYISHICPCLTVIKIDWITNSLVLLQGQISDFPILLNMKFKSKSAKDFFFAFINVFIKTLVFVKRLLTGADTYSVNS